MHEHLLDYYERELIYLRRLGGEFARAYPRVAGRLQLEANRCGDPHVERLLEGVAFLTARVQLRLDEDFPEISEALLNLVYPHALLPVPSCTVVELRLDEEQGKATTALAVPRGAPLHSQPVDGVPCRFRTCYDTAVWPIGVESAAWQTPELAGDAVGMIRVGLRCHQDLTFATLGPERLRFYLNGEPGLVHTVYELLLNSCAGVVVRRPGDAGPAFRLPASALAPVGFDPEDGLLPRAPQSFLGHRLLQEYFVFPEKFLFVDLDLAHGAPAAERFAGFGREAELLFLVRSFGRPERRQTLAAGVSAGTFRLGCTPAVNLFSRAAEPIALTERRHEYVVVPDAHRPTTEAFAVEEVRGTAAGTSNVVRFEPFYAYRHRGADDEAPEQFWYARRRPSAWQGAAESSRRPRELRRSDLVLSFVDRAARPAVPRVDTVTAWLLCFNANLPHKLRFGTPSDFTLPQNSPARITALVPPTEVVQPPPRDGRLWRLVSQLSLNHLSLANGPEPLREILRLHDAAGTPAGERQVQGLAGIASRAAYARVASPQGLAFARGTRIELELDEDCYAGGAFLFASLLERFFGLYASMNSFSQLSARTRQRHEPLGAWAPRAGTRPLA
jgi:type VI secretion system protein ImpG